MPTVFDVRPADLIEKLSEYLQKHVEEVKPPEWAIYVKLSSHNIRPPQDKNWWYVRAASLLRKIYIHGPIGVERLRKMYGGRRRNRTRPEHSRKAAGGIIRKILIQLEAAGLVEKTPKGRVLTPKGRSLLDKISTIIVKKEYQAEKK